MLHCVVENFSCGPLSWSHSVLVHVLQGHTSLDVAQKHALIRLLKINVHTSSHIQELSRSCPQLHSNLPHSHASCYSSILGYKWRNQLELSLSNRGCFGRILWHLLERPSLGAGQGCSWPQEPLEPGPELWSGFCTSHHCSSLGIDSLLPFFFFFK